MNRIVLLCLTLFLHACANPYAKFYNGMQDARTSPGYVQSAGELQIVRTDDSDRDAKALAAKGYFVIGESNFSAATIPFSEYQMREMAGRIGAQVVLISQKDSATASAALRFTIPDTTFGAVFMALRKYRFGAVVEPLDEETRRNLGVNFGVRVIAVVEGSPADRAGILPGDILLKIEADDVMSASALQQSIDRHEGLVSVELMRAKSRIEKRVELARFAARPLAPGSATKGDSDAVRRVLAGANPAAIEWTDKSLASANRGEWAEAIRASSAAISLNPGLVPAYINRCWAYMGHGDLEEGLKDCETVLKVDPGNVLAINNRGAIVAQQGKEDAALADYERACQGGLELACENFRKIRGYSPKDTAAIANRMLDDATGKFSDGNWGAVIASTSKVIDMAPGNVSAYVSRSGAYANTGRLPDALADAETAIRLNPNDGMAYNNRGYAFELMNKPRQASLDFEIACNLKVELGCVNLKRIRQ